METAMKVAPRGLPTWRRRVLESDGEGDEGLDGLAEEGLEAIEVLRRKSCVTAMPMLAKEREVRSQARKVRSGLSQKIVVSTYPRLSYTHAE